MSRLPPNIQINNELEFKFICHNSFTSKDRPDWRYEWYLLFENPTQLPCTASGCGREEKLLCDAKTTFDLFDEKLTMYRSRTAVKSKSARTRTRFSLHGLWLSLGINLNVIVPSAFCCQENRKTLGDIENDEPNVENGNRSITYENLKNIVGRFAQYVYAVDFHDLVTGMD